MTLNTMSSVNIFAQQTNGQVDEHTDFYRSTYYSYGKEDKKD